MFHQQLEMAETIRCQKYGGGHPDHGRADAITADAIWKGAMAICEKWLASVKDVKG